MLFDYFEKFLKTPGVLVREHEENVVVMRLSAAYSGVL